MSSTDSVNTRVQALLLSIQMWVSKWWIKFGLIPILIGGPASFFIIYFTRDRYRKQIDSIFGSDISAVLNDYSIQILIVAIIVWYGLSVIHPVLDALTSTDSTVNYKTLITLNRSLEQIVKSKADRFGIELESVSEPVPAGNVFKSITKPEQQILFIANALHIFLEQIWPEIAFRIRLIGIENNKPARWITHVPLHEDPETDLSDLDHPDSTITNCLIRKKIQIIPDTNLESVKPGRRKFVKFRDENGSLICYPIHHKPTTTIPYAISIWSDKPGFFKIKNKKLYQWILSNFALRIQLEHSLIKLKEKASDER